MLTSKVYPDARVYGPYYSDRDKRHYITVYINKRRVAYMYYSRFLYQEYLGRLLEPWEEVDHKDNNKLNDNLDNLQLLSTTENVSKSNANRAIYPETATEVCFQCEKQFQMNRKDQANYKRAIAAGRFGPFCSKSCATKFGNDQRG